MKTVTVSKILYTGDFSRQEDRHLMAAEVPNIRPDVLITVRFSFFYQIYFTHKIDNNILGSNLWCSYTWTKRTARESFHSTSIWYCHARWPLPYPSIRSWSCSRITSHSWWLIFCLYESTFLNVFLSVDEYWASHPQLHEFPIYYASSLAKKCISVYQTYIDAMNEKIRKQSAVSNPFKFKHIASLRVIRFIIFMYILLSMHVSFIMIR